MCLHLQGTITLLAKLIAYLSLPHNGSTNNSQTTVRNIYILEDTARGTKQTYL